MCLIIASPNGNEIPFNDIRRGFVRNPHGAGFMYAKDGALHVQKGFFNLRDLWEAVKDINGTCPLVIHLRLANVGPQNPTNCHPWQINENFAMVHNGTLRKYTRLNNGLSDTGNFTEIVLKPLFADYPELFGKPYFTALLSETIQEDKMVIMSANGETNIYNVGQGIWKDGVWYSNNSYRPLPKKMVKTTFQKGKKGTKKVVVNVKA